MVLVWLLFSTLIRLTVVAPAVGNLYADTENTTLANLDVKF